jgi:hypothetical protein
LRCAARADDGFASLDVYDFHRSADVLLVLVIGGGLAMRRVDRRRPVHADARRPRRNHAAVLAILDRAAAGHLVLVGAERIAAWRAGCSGTRQVRTGIPRHERRCSRDDGLHKAFGGIVATTTCRWPHAWRRHA